MSVTWKFSTSTSEFNTRVNLSDLHLYPISYLGDSENGTFDYPVQYKPAINDKLCSALIVV